MSKCRIATSVDLLSMMKGSKAVILLTISELSPVWRRISPSRYHTNFRSSWVKSDLFVSATFWVAARSTFPEWMPSDFCLLATATLLTILMRTSNPGKKCGSSVGGATVFRERWCWRCSVGNTGDK